MATLPGDTSPPKPGCSRRAGPLLIKAMKPAEAGSTGAALISVFHQLCAGNKGSGRGGGAPSTGNHRRALRLSRHTQHAGQRHQQERQAFRKHSALSEAACRGG
jgi:hypothetical protein